MKKIISLSLFAVLACSCVFASSGGMPTTGGKPTTPPPVNTVKNPVKGLVILGDNYAVDSESVYVVNSTRSAWVKIVADRASFRVMLGQFARDKNAIYQMGRVIPGADLASFSVISGQHGYAQDDNHIYGPQGMMPEADPETFKMLTKNYSIDSGHVFFDGKLLPDADSGSFEVIDNGLYAVDDKRVFYAGKILKDTSPDGFTVKGPRAFARDGRTFFEGLIERGDLPTGEPQAPTEPTEPEPPVIIPPVDAIDSADTWDALRAKIAPYKAYFTGGNAPFWMLMALGALGVFSLFFVFFADRNDEPVSLWKSVTKTLIALLIMLVAVWLASYFLSPTPALIVGFIVGVFFFITLWNALGWIKSLLITLLTLIGIVFIMAIGFIVLRMMFDDTQSILEFINQPRIQLLGVIKIIAFFLGAWLIMAQLGSSLVRALGQAFVATVISTIILGLIMWITGIGTFLSIIVFALLYAVLLWIMRFRMVSNLFVETVRIFRVALILAVVIGLVVWIIL